MEPDEWAAWQDANRRASQNRIERPCQECPLGFAAEMRAIDRCNGTPAGVDDEEEDQVPEITKPIGKPVTVALDTPCGRCIHREVCSIRQSLEAAMNSGVEVELPRLNPALTPTLSIAVECALFRRDSLAVGWTPERRAAQAERTRHARAVGAAKRAAAAAG